MKIIQNCMEEMTARVFDLFDSPTGPVRMNPKIKECHVEKNSVILFIPEASEPD